MKFHMTGTTAHLEGVWTQAGVSQSVIDSMAVFLSRWDLGVRRANESIVARRTNRYMMICFHCAPCLPISC